MLRTRGSRLVTVVAVLASPGAAPAEEGADAAAYASTRIGATTIWPVIVIGREAILASGQVSIGDFLRTLPQQGNALGPGVNLGGDGSSRVNLRGVGVSRTLVLVNGRRFVPGGSGADGSVDLSAIPSAAVERVEILTGGASARYGSDAIAGVVNVITREGGGPTDVALYTGTSGHGDRTTMDVSLTAGARGDRAGGALSAAYRDEREVSAADRSFSRFRWAYDTRRGRYGVGSSAIPAGRTLAGGVSGSGNALWAALESTGADSYVFEPDPANATACGTLVTGQTVCYRPFLGSGIPAAGGVAVGEGYNFAGDDLVATPQRRVELFAAGDLKLGTAARAFLEGSYGSRRSEQRFAPFPLFADGLGLLASADGLYDPFAKDVFVVRRMVELGPQRTREDVDAFRVVGGIDGTAPRTFGPLAGWSWEVALDWGRTSAAVTADGAVSFPALADAIGPSMLVNGVPTCLTTPGDPSTAIRGCVPVNLFGGPGAITPEQVAGIAFTGRSHGSNELLSVGATASGDLVRLLADRRATLAVGYEHRELSGSFENDPLAVSTSAPRGIEARGSYRVDEVHAELAVPILSGRPLADDLEATAAARWSGYSTFGAETAYALGARWRPVRDVTFRGAYGTAFRAPTIPESFAAQQETYPVVSDPCRGGPGAPPVTQACLDAGVPPGGTGDQSTRLLAVVGGNPDVGAERARTFTLGLVVEPRWVRDLTVAVGYWSIDVDGTIGAYGERTILDGCYSGARPELCSRVVRDPTTHLVDRIWNLNDNAGKLATAGVDLGVRWVLPARRLGRFAFAVDATWLQRIDETLPDGTVVHGRSTFDLNALNSGGGAGGTFPAWKANAGVTWARAGVGAGISTRLLGSFHECGRPYDSNGDGIADAADFSGQGLCYVDARFQRKVGAYHAEDAFVSYAFRWSAGRTSLTAGVRNLLDRDPATIYDGAASATDPYTYDQVGRFFYVRLAQTY